MKRKLLNNQSYSVILVIVVIFIAVWAGIGAFADEEKTAEVRISVIVEDSNHVRWSTFQQGIEQAAREHGVDLTYVTTGEYESQQEEMDLIEQRIQDGADGIILSPYSSDEISLLQDRVSGGTQLILVENRVHPLEDESQTITAITPDYKGMAEKLAEEIKKDFAGQLAGQRVKILLSHNKSLGMEEAVASLQKALQNSVAEVLVSDDLTPSRLKKGLSVNSCGIILALDDKSLWAVAKEKNGLEKCETRIYGIGCSEPNLYYLEHDTIQCMLVANDYKMGYVSLTTLTDSIREFRKDLRNAEIDFKTIRPDEIHIQENERYLFPVIQ